MWEKNLLSRRILLNHAAKHFMGSSVLYILFFFPVRSSFYFIFKNILKSRTHKIFSLLFLLYYVYLRSKIIRKVYYENFYIINNSKLNAACFFCKKYQFYMTLIILGECSINVLLHVQYTLKCSLFFILISVYMFIRWIQILYYKL